VTPRDLTQLATRIERLVKTRRHGWSSSAELDFKNKLPGGRDTRRRLPSSKELKEWADKMKDDRQLQRNILPKWRQWITTTLNLEGIAQENDPRNPKRQMRDQMRGRFPRRSAQRIASAQLVASRFIEVV
jgi:hypothetical protein